MPVAIWTYGIWSRCEFDAAQFRICLLRKLRLNNTRDKSLEFPKGPRHSGLNSKLL